MTDKANDKDKLLNDAIKASIDFEELMDQTDFDSWLDTDSPETLKKCGQLVGPFINYKNNEKRLKKKCSKRINGTNKIHNAKKYQIEKEIISELFSSKYKRLDARIASEKDEEKKKYEEARFHLLSALNALQTREEDNNKRWLILLYNDLSICYAGLEKSSMSRGYAEEAKRIIEKEDSYKSFDKNIFSFSEIPTDKKQQKELLKYLRTIGYRHLSKSLKDVKYILEGNNQIAVTKDGTRIAILEIKNDLCYLKRGDESDIKLGLVKKEDDKLKIYSDHDFVSSKLFELYTISLFNQALAERRSQQYNEAERNFKKIIKYAEENTHLLNFNYYSAILNLSDLYMDLSRGREAIELLDKINKKLEKDDIRYWKAYLYEITALIDQSEYDMAEGLLKTFKKGKSGFTLNKKHKVTSTGFKGLARYARCKIENVKNTIGNSEKSELRKAKEIIEASIEDIQERKQTGLETKAYKQLSDIYKILSQDEEDKDSSEYDVKVITCLIRFISEAEIKIGDLGEFISHEKRDYWIDKCDDLNALESFTGQIIKVTTDEPIDKYRDLLEKLKEKIKRECEDKNQLSRAKKTVTKI
jgi:hypothetical protein